MGAAWLGVGLQAILVMFLLMSPPFLPCALAAGCSSEGKSGDQVVGMVREMQEGHDFFASSKSTWSRRILNAGEDGRHNPPFSPGHK
uniref:Uncharacterized protein n=1 Tax=Oryza glaberrima TaxID=4538 RepID=I1NYI7_ORYGL